MYIENPKTKGSGIFCAIPQTGICPNKCADCFFQSGRSYIEPLADHLPNMPNEGIMNAHDNIIRVNDGNDSYFLTDEQISMVNAKYSQCFYNTAVGMGRNLATETDAIVKIAPQIDYEAKFQNAPFVLTINPGKYTDTDFYRLDPIPKNLMFVRIRVNTWNLGSVVKPAVEYYSQREVPIILTFMAYYQLELEAYKKRNYVFKKRTLNDYWVIKPSAWKRIMSLFEGNKWVYSCGKDANTHACRHCGNCLREYYATKLRIGEN